MFSQSLIPIYSLRFMACYFMIVNAIAIYLYPGGSLYNYDLTSYSFTENFCKWVTNGGDYTKKEEA